MKAFAVANRMLVVCVVTAVLLAGAAPADERATWNFVIETEGEDVYWTSPTAVDNTADHYDMGYEITQVVVTVRYLFFEFDVDVTDQIPPEQLSGSGIFDGPPPIVLYEGDLRYPEPPAPIGLAAHVEILLDAGGFGQIAVTDVILGEIEVYVEPYGTVTVELLAIHLEGLFTVVPLWYQEGDLNCDGLINAFDIDAFVLALTDPAGYAAAWPDCDRMLADCNGDGVVDAFDIDPFVDLLTGE